MSRAEGRLPKASGWVFGLEGTTGAQTSSSLHPNLSTVPEGTQSPCESSQMFAH